MSYEYTKLLWSIAFRIMEEPLQTNFKNSINQVSHSHLSLLLLEERHF